MIQEKHFNYYFTKNEKSRSQKQPVTKLFDYIFTHVGNCQAKTLCAHQKLSRVEIQMNNMEMKLFGDDLKVEVDIWELFD